MRKYKNEVEISSVKYVGYNCFLTETESGNYTGKKSENRLKYDNFLELNDFFGAELVYSEELSLENENEEYYLRKEDVKRILEKSKPFFEDFGLSNKEIAEKIIGKSKNKKIFEAFIKKTEYPKDYPPAFVDFVKIMADVNIDIVDKNNINKIIPKDCKKETKKLIVKLINHANSEKPLKQTITVKRNRTARKAMKAYKQDQFVCFAKMLFDKKYEKEHHLLQKAFDNPTDAERWLFWSLHYVCGWRASDICDDWIYPGLSETNNPFDIDIKTIKEDLLSDNISDETLEKITLYILKKIELKSMLPSKTRQNAGSILRAEMHPILRPHFGKLMLIAEYHHLNNGSGYMSSKKISRYSNWPENNNFFGKGYIDCFRKRNVSSRRMNKSYLQSLERAAIENGKSPLVASMIAALARNHSNLSMTSSYLKDNEYTGEDAEVVLFMMMQRGAYSSFLYNALKTAYPESFKSLSSKDKTEIMVQTGITPYALELKGIEVYANEKIKELFVSNRGEVELTNIIRAMYAIGNCGGRSKEKGVACIKTALGFLCDYPEKGCIESLCPYHVFTSSGIYTLLDIIKEYMEKAEYDKRYESILMDLLIPKFQKIRGSIADLMSDKETETLNRYIKEQING